MMHSKYLPGHVTPSALRIGHWTFNYSIHGVVYSDEIVDDNNRSFKTPTGAKEGMRTLIDALRHVEMEDHKHYK